MTEDTLQTKVDIENKARKEGSANEIATESPLEEVKRVNEETKRNIQLLSEERAKLEKLQANILVQGRAFAGEVIKNKSQEELDQEQADKMVKSFLSQKWVVLK